MAAGYRGYERGSKCTVDSFVYCEQEQSVLKQKFVLHMNTSEQLIAAMATEQRGKVTLGELFARKRSLAVTV